MKKILKKIAKKQTISAFTWLDAFEPKMPKSLAENIEK